MARYYGYDVRNLIKTKLESDFNTMITTIRTERSDSTIPLVVNITIDKMKHQYPEIYIDITESELINDFELTSSIDLTPEIFMVEITAILKSQLDTIDVHADYYIEAMQRILHGYNDSNITWILTNKTIRTDVTDEKKQTYKVCGVVCEIRIN